jgi:hypothetical protein
LDWRYDCFFWRIILEIQKIRFSNCEYDLIKTYQILTYFITTVWLINGLFCKVLNLVPRHEEIVGRVLGNLHSQILTIPIGVSEIIMAIWILSGFKSNRHRRLDLPCNLLVLLGFIRKTPSFSLTLRRLSPYLTFCCNENDIHLGNPAYVLCYNDDEFLSAIL